MSTLLYYLLVGLGGIFFSFASWRKLKEDYSASHIFTATIFLLLGGVCGWFIFNKWLPDFSFWGFLGGIVIFSLYAIRRMDFKFFETLDGVVEGFLWLGIFLETTLVVREGWGAWGIRAISPFVFIIPLLAYKLVFKRYRRFSWYPSGKIGFMGGAASALFFLLRMVVDLGEGWMLSSPSKLVDAGFSLIVSVTFFLVLYVRSGRSDAKRLIMQFERKKKRKR